MSTFIILGSVLGVLVTIFFTENLGRKGTTNFGLLVSVIGMGIMLIHSQPCAVIGVFLYSAGLANSFTIITTFIVEFFPEENNAQYFNLLTLSFAIGTAINPIVFYLIDNWKLFLIFVFLIPTVITLVGFYFIVESTPIELIAADDYEETYNAFMRIAKWNGVTDHGLTLNAVKEIK
jgi:MFS family permease